MSPEPATPNVPGTRDYYRNLARSYALQAGLDPDIFEAQINQESGFNPLAGPSSGGAQGIAQIIPRWHPGVDTWNPEESLQYAANLMAGHLRNYGGDIRKALTAYHAGSGNLAEAMRVGGANWETALFNVAGQDIARANQSYLSIILGGGPILPSGVSLPDVIPGLSPVSTGREMIERFGDDFRRRLNEVRATIFGRPATETINEPFPGFQEMFTPLITEFNRNILLLEESQRFLEAPPSPPRTGTGIRGLGGIALPIGFSLVGIVKDILPFLEGPTEEAINERNEAMLQHGTLLQRQADLGATIGVIQGQIKVYQGNVPSDVRAEEQAKIDAFMASAGSQVQELAQPILDAISDYVSEPIDILGTATEEELASLSEAELTEVLFTQPRARPIASYLLTTEQLRLSLRGFRPTGPPDEMTGNALRSLLAAQGANEEDIRAFEEEVGPQIDALIADALEIQERTAAIKAGLEGAIIPSPGALDYLKATAIQPLLVASSIIEKWNRYVVQPAAGTFLILTAMPDTDIGRKFEDARQNNNIWMAAGEAFRETEDTGVVHKFALEMVFDPVSWIGWGIAPKLLKPIPKIGTLLSKKAAAAELAYLNAVNVPFKAVGHTIGKIPKPTAVQALLAEQDMVRTTTKFLNQVIPGKTWNRLSAKADVIPALQKAVDLEQRFPQVVDDLRIPLVQALKERPHFSLDDLEAWVTRVGGTTSRNVVRTSQNILLDIDDKLALAVLNPKDKPAVAKALMTILGVTDDSKKIGFNKVKALVQQHIDDTDLQVQRLIVGDNVENIIKQIGKHGSDTTLANRASRTAAIAETRGMLTRLALQDMPSGLAAAWSTVIEKPLIMPLARAFLLFPMYHPFNVLETFGKIIVQGFSPYGKGDYDRLMMEAFGMPAIRGRGVFMGEEVRDIVAAKTTVGRWWQRYERNVLLRDWSVKVQASMQVKFQYNMAVEMFQRNPNTKPAWDRIQGLLDDVGMDFPFLPVAQRQYTRDAIIASILKDPQAVRNLPLELSLTKLEEIEVAKILPRYALLDNPIQSYVLGQAKTGRLWTDFDKVMDEVRELAWDSYLKSPAHFVARFEAMADEIVDAPIKTHDDLMARILALQTMNKSYREMADVQLRVAQEWSERVVRIADNDTIWATYRTSTEMFETQAGAAIDRASAAIKQHIHLADRATDVEALITKYSVFKSVQAGAYAEQRNVARQIFTVEAPTPQQRGSFEWWRATKGRLGQPFRDAEDRLDQLSSDIFDLEATVGRLAKNPINDVSSRAISRADMAVLFGMPVDRVTAYVYLEDLQAMMGQRRFINEVLDRARWNLKAGENAAQLGWTREKIGKLWDDIAREWRQDPTNVSVLAPTHMQINDLEIALKDARLGVELPDESITAFRGIGEVRGEPTEGVGLYVTSDRALAGRFGPVTEVVYRKPRNPLVVKDEPLFLLMGEGDIFAAVREGDSTWTRLHKQAVKNLGIGPEDPFNVDVVGAEFTRLARGKGYDAVVIQGTEGTEAWTVILDDALVGPTEFQRWADDLADGLERIPGYFNRSNKRTTLTWEKGKGEAVSEAFDEFHRAFPDYINLTYFDTIMRAQFPYWIYEWHRPFWLARQFMRTPGMLVGLGRYTEYTGGDNYIHVPYTSLEINPLRGTILMGGLRRLLIQDYPEFYDTFPEAQQALDVIGRFGFYPGSHVTALNILFGGGVPFSQLGDIVPASAKAPIQGFRAFAQATGNENLISLADAFANTIIPERFRNYKIAMKVSDLGVIDPETGLVINGATINDKKIAGTPLDPLEEEAWIRATGELAIWDLLMDQTSLFRLRPPERDKAREAYDALISEYTGYTLEQLENFRKWDIRWQDTIPPDPAMRDLLNATEYIQRWAGFSSVLFDVGGQNFRARRNEFWDVVEAQNGDFQVEQENLDCEFGFVGATTCVRPGSITANDWLSGLREIGQARGRFIDDLKKQDRYKDIPVTHEEVLAFYKKTNQPLPTEHPLRELVRIFYELEPKEKFDPETGRKELDFDTYYVLQEMILQAAGEFRDELETQVRKNDTELRALHRFSFTQFLRPYFNRRELAISRFPPEMQVIIRRWQASDNVLERDQLEQIQFQGRSLIGQFQQDLKVSGKRLRFFSPDVDAWLAFWGKTSSFVTDEGQRRYEDLMRRYRPHAPAGAFPVDRTVELEPETTNA